MAKKKKKPTRPDYICTCGHLEKDHHSNSPWDGWCNKCSFEKDDKDFVCIEFRFDALLYLEELNRLSGNSHYNYTEGRHGY